MPQEWDEKGNPIKAPMEWDEKGNPIGVSDKSEAAQVKAGLPGVPKPQVNMQPSFLGGARPTQQQSAGIDAQLPQVPGIVSGNRNAALTGASLAPAGAAIATTGAAALPGIARATLLGMVGGQAGKSVGSFFGPTGAAVGATVGSLAGGYAGAKGMKVPGFKGSVLEKIFSAGGSAEDAALAKKTVDVTDPSVSQDLISRMKKLVIPGEQPTAQDLKRAGDLTQAPQEMLKSLAKFGDKLAQNEINRRLLMGKIPRVQ